MAIITAGCKQPEETRRYDMAVEKQTHQATMITEDVPSPGGLDEDEKGKNAIDGRDDIDPTIVPYAVEGCRNGNGRVVVTSNERQTGPGDDVVAVFPDR